MFVFCRNFAEICDGNCIGIGHFRQRIHLLIILDLPTHESNTSIYCLLNFSYHILI